MVLSAATATLFTESAWLGVIVPVATAMSVPIWDRVVKQPVRQSAAVMATAMVKNMDFFIMRLLCLA